MSQAFSQRQRLQAAVDAAALAAAHELGLADARRENVQAVVAAMVGRAMEANRQAGSTPVLETTVRDQPLEVQVVGRQMTRSLFGIGLMATEIEVASVARIIGRPNICVLGLDPSANGTISLEKNARVTGQNCAVFSNSTHHQGIRSKDSASLAASLICSAGGGDGGKGNFTPEPLQDCPTFADPLASRPEPQAAPCDKAKRTEIVASTSLAPGTFCGGLKIGAGAEVTLEPGIYVIKDGPLSVADDASLIGKGVGIFLTGQRAEVSFEARSTIDLAAATSGPMAGLLFFEGRGQPESGTHRISSDNARNLLGTLYFPRGRLHVDANSPIADRSAYTAIVARKLTLYGGPHLVLNSNYGLTDVPVPDGIRGAAQPISLVK